jgi:hypothetical protein
LPPNPLIAESAKIAESLTQRSPNSGAPLARSPVVAIFLSSNSETKPVTVAR